MGTSDRILRHLSGAGARGASLDDLSDAISDVSRKALVMSTNVLATRALISRPALGHYRITDAGLIAIDAGNGVKPGKRGPRQAQVFSSSLRARVWLAMRAMGKFSIDDLLLRGAVGDEANAHDNVGRYLNALEAGGYLVRLRARAPGEAPTSRGYVRWLLVRNTGPMAPVWRRRLERLYDPNTGEVIDLAGQNSKEATHA